MKLAPEREKLYRDLKERVGNTPLVEFTALPVPNGNRIFLKDESNTVKGTAQPLNHYGRVFPAVYEELEETGRIRPGMAVFDTSQGNAALALTLTGKILEFVPYSIVPRDHLSQNMLAYLSAAGAKLVETDGSDYVNDFEAAIRKLREYFRQEKIPFGFLNHSMKSGGLGKSHINNETTLKALETIAEEVMHQLPIEHGLEKPDYFIGVWGNGSSLFGPGRLFRQKGVEVIGWELFSQSIAYELAYPGKYQGEFCIPLTTLVGIHGIPGSSYRGRGGPIDFPHIRNAVTGNNPIITDTRLVTDNRMLSAYGEIVKKPELVQKVGTLLPRLDSTMEQLLAAGCDFGRTTAGNIAVALDLAKQIGNKVIVTLLYDRLDKYDTPLQR